jgi:hypothetical protein
MARPKRLRHCFFAACRMASPARQGGSYTVLTAQDSRGLELAFIHSVDVVIVDM